jgi:coronin-1B/1C/6
VEPLCFNVPRKSEAFQDDIYPDTAAPVPAHSSDEWLAGSHMTPVLMSLNPANSGAMSSAAPKEFVAPKSPLVLQQELASAQDRIKVLEARLAAAGLSTE